jgi:hypothetical protein
MLPGRKMHTCRAKSGLTEAQPTLEDMLSITLRNDQYRPVVLRNGARVDIEEEKGFCDGSVTCTIYDVITNLCGGKI